MKRGKSPGDNGFTNEFYKKLKMQIAPSPKKAYNYALQTGKWAQTWQSSILTLIPKEGKDTTKCSSYMPISLLNTDYKRISAILANRLKTIITDIIDADQCGFIPGRYLADNIRRTINLINYAQNKNIDAVLLTLDAQKAFDLMSWPFMFEMLDSFGVDNKFCLWIQVIYSNPTSRIKTNGTLSRRIQIQRGTRQGDPLSPLIFAMYIEILAATVRQNIEIKGLQIGKETHKLALYADDIIVFLTSPEESIHELMKTIAEYGKISGYTLNMSKCESLIIGRQPSQALKEYYSFKWENKKVNYLGINISEHLEELYENNHCALITKMGQDLSRWGLIPHSFLSSRNY